MYPQNNVDKSTHPGQNFTKYKICILQFFQNMGFRKMSLHTTICLDGFELF